MPMVCDTLQPNPSTPFTSDNESHPMEKTVLIKYISHLNQSIPDDGDSEFPKFNLYKI
jgi:hypothetical protein